MNRSDGVIEGGLTDGRHILDSLVIELVKIVAGPAEPLFTLYSLSDFPFKTLLIIYIASYSTSLAHS